MTRLRELSPLGAEAARVRDRYAVGVLSANIFAAVELFAVVGLITRPAGGGGLFTAHNVVVVGVLIVLGVGVAATWSVVTLGPSLRWFAQGTSPTAQEQHDALRIAFRQSIVHAAVWTVGGVAFLLANLGVGPDVVAVVVLAVVFGGATTSFLGYLVADYTLRPVISAAMESGPKPHRLAGLATRMITTWALCSAVPAASIAVLVIAHATGWLIPRSADIEAPVLLLSAIAIVGGLRGTLLLARTVSDPVREVSSAMEAVRSGTTDVAVSVYDSSEIGGLQAGFNSMVRGLAERERLRDLFDRHVGTDVAQRALDREERLGGEVLSAAVLFIDLVDSTGYAAARTPDDVAVLLNRFFRVVVGTVERHHGFVNKFEGDAALAIFGTPRPVADCAGAALAAARELRAELVAIETVDFGIGVAFGDVFAGNIGAEQRYEFTVVGDPVNEAARLTEIAKGRPRRVLASGRAGASAADEEARLWCPSGNPVTLRGRAVATELLEPRL